MQQLNKKITKFTKRPKIQQKNVYCNYPGWHLEYIQIICHEIFILNEKKKNISKVQR